jgi:hypothetical protein
MNLMITLIGNAVVDSIFRHKFLADPLGTADAYGFQLTKGEVKVLAKVFTNEAQEALERDFQKLEETLWPVGQPCKKPPCAWSLYPPPEYRADYFAAEEKEAAVAEEKEAA